MWPPSPHNKVFGEDYGSICRRHRPGHDQLALHRFRQGRDHRLVGQKEHEQIYPKPGYVEHDPLEIWRNTQEVIREALAKKGLSPRDLAAIGITNQRETTLIWDKRTGKPLHNALVWQDTRVDAAVEEFARTAATTACAPRPACRWRAISPG